MNRLLPLLLLAACSSQPEMFTETKITSSVTNAVTVATLDPCVELQADFELELERYWTSFGDPEADEALEAMGAITDEQLERGCG